VSTPRKPDLDQLIKALTADGRPDELADRDAALASFRAASRRGAADGAARRRRMPLRRPLTALPRRLAAIGAALVVVAAGVTAAAYAQALPGPAQGLAHTVFAGLGVPNSQLSPGTGSSAVTIATPGGKSRKASTGSPRTPAPRPGDDYRVSVAVSRVRVPAGGVVVFTGRVTDLGHVAAGARVRLFERLAGSAQFELVATGVTGPYGGFRLSSPPLAATAIFRVLGPDSAHSVAVKVTVAAAKITARVAAAPGPAATG
jgi:hypothetical protein